MSLRGRAFGWVEDLQGVRVADARVFLAARPALHRVESGPPDEVAVVADAEGRFEAALLRGRPYSAWAVLAPGEEGGPLRVTEVREGVSPGTPLVLVEAREVLPVRVRLAGAEAWEDEGPLRVEAVPETAAQVRLGVERDEEGQALLPPLPGARCHVEVRTPAGLPLASRSVPLSAEMREHEAARLGGVLGEGDEEPAFTLERTTLFVPPPLRVPATVRSAVHRAPLEGAEILLVERGFWGLAVHLLATTDVEGECVLRVPASLDAHGQRRQHLLRTFRVRAPGHLTMEIRHRPDPGDGQEGEPLSTDLVGATALRGRVLLGASPAPGLTVLVESRMPSGPRSFMQLSGTAFSTETGEDGALVLEGLSPSSPLRLLVVVPEGAARAAGLVEAGGAPISPLVWLGSYVPGQFAGEDLGDLDIARAYRLDVRVRAWDGAPADSPRILAVEEETARRPSASFPMEAQADRLGRLRLLLPRERLRVGALDASGAMAFEELVLSGTEEAGGALDLVLTRPVEMTGRVVDAAGEPLEGATVRATVRMATGVDQVVRRLVSQARPLPAVTDAEGRFRIAVGAPSTLYNVAASIRSGGRTHSSRPLQVDVDDEPVTGIEIELDAPRPDEPEGEGGR